MEGYFSGILITVFICLPNLSTLPWFFRFIFNIVFVFGLNLGNHGSKLKGGGGAMGGIYMKT